MDTRIEGNCFQNSIKNETIQIKTLSGKTIGIDGTLWLYQILCAIRKSNNGALLNSKGDDITILNTLFNRLLSLKKLKIKPIFVFDGNCSIISH